MAELERLGQIVAASGDTAHQHISPATGVFGQGMHADINAALVRVCCIAKIERRERHARTPCVVQCSQHAMRLAYTKQRG